MKEKAWVEEFVIPEIQKAFRRGKLDIGVGRRLPYAYQIRRYGDKELKKDGNPERRDYETDVLISEQVADQVWTPRVVIEAKTKLHTHDALTYKPKGGGAKKCPPPTCVTGCWWLEAIS